MTTLQSLKLLLFMSCQEAASLISQAMDQPLEPPARAAVGLHLAICSSCRRYRGQLGLLRRVLALIGPGTVKFGGHTLAPEAKIRIRAKLERQRFQDGG